MQGKEVACFRGGKKTPDNTKFKNEEPKAECREGFVLAQEQDQSPPAWLRPPVPPTHGAQGQEGSERGSGACLASPEVPPG